MARIVSPRLTRSYTVAKAPEGAPPVRGKGWSHPTFVSGSDNSTSFRTLVADTGRVERRSYVQHRPRARGTHRS